MKYSSLIVLLILSSLCAKAQGPCDELLITELSLNPLNPDLLVVKVLNESSEIFSYPGFRVYSDGVLLGEEVVEFFGIGETSEHAVPHNLGPVVQGEEFTLELELWTGFYETLACSFTGIAILYPEVECADLEVVVTFTEVGTETVRLEMRDFQGEWILDTLVQNTGGNNFYHMIPVCIHENCYEITLTPEGSLSFDADIHSLVTLPNSYWNFSENGGTAEADEFTFSFGIDVYYGCGTDLVEYDEQELPFEFTSEGVLNRGAQIIEITIYDLKGAIVQSVALTPFGQALFNFRGPHILHWESESGTGAMRYITE